MAGRSPTRKLAKMAAGQRYGRLVAFERVGRNRYRQSVWRFNCDCGNTTIATANGVRSSEISSCGCLIGHTRSSVSNHKPPPLHTTHGLSNSPEYRSWKSMMQRCLNPKQMNFKDYGGRGIKVCERWLKFENFYSDMGPRTSPQHEIERKNNDGGYSPDNCIWATRAEQNRNRRTNHIVSYNDQRITLTDAAKLAGLKPETIRKRLRLGWNIERALSTPVKAR